MLNPVTQYAVDEYRDRPDAASISPASDGGVWTFRAGTVGITSGWAFDGVSGAAFRVTRETGHVDLMASISIFYAFEGKPTLIIRENAGGTTWMQAVLDTDGKLYIEKVVAGVTTRLPGSSAVMSFANATTSAFQFEGNGSTYTVYWNGTNVFSLTDTSVTTGTRAGYAFAANGAVRVNQWQANRVELLSRVATQVIVTRQPTLVAQTAVAHPTQPIFAVADSNGDTMTSATGTMTLTLVDDTGSGTSIGTLTKSIVAGAADFTGLGLGVTGVGTNHWHASNGTVTGDSAVFTVQAGAVTAEQVIVAQLGGDAKVTAFYDARTGVGVTGSNVNTWDDVRGGGGFGPQLVATAASGAKPIYDGTNKTIETNQAGGNTNWLASAAGAVFDPSTSERTLVYIGTAESGQTVIAQLANLASTKYLGIGGNGAAIVQVRSSAGGGLSVQPVASTTRRLWAVSVPLYAGGPGNAPVIGHAGGRAIVTGTMTGAFAAGSWALVLGGTTSAAGAPVYSHAIVRAVLVIDHRLSSTEWDALQAYASAQHAIVMDETIPMVMYDGNSITYGQLATTGNNIPGRVLTALPGHEYGNNGVPSQTGATILTHQWARSLPAYDAAHPKNVYVYWGEGFNELAEDIGGYTAYRHMVDACLAARARGFKVLVATVLNANTTITGARETARLLQNSLTRANWSSFADAIADVAQITAMQNPADTSLYPDGIHPNDAGYALLANDTAYGFIHNITPLLSGAGAGVADHLAEIQAASGFAQGSSCTTPAIIAVKDSLGGTVTGFSGTVTMIGTGLTGPTILPVFNGLATFRRVACTTLGSLTPAYYCAGLTGVSGTPTTVTAAVGTFYRGAELPRATPALPAWMVTQATGSADVTVTATSAADLQSRIATDAALVAGTGGNLNRDYLIPDGATWLTTITWPNRDPAVTGWMRVRSASALPTTTGTRASAAALVGKAILETNTTSAVFGTAAPNVGAQTNIPHHYALAGLTLRAQPGMGTGFWLIGWGTGTNQDTFAKVPHHLVLDRCVVDGQNSDQTHALFDSAGWHIVRDCAFLNIHSQSSDGGHAITLGNGDGPGLIENNTLQCSGVIVLLGGSDPNVAELIPSDITIRTNLFTRDPLWNRPLYGTYPSGSGWLVKNNLDLKNCQRVLREGNIYENSWTDGQAGSLTNIKSVNQGGGAPWCGTTDLVSRNEVYRNANEAHSLAGRPNPTAECVPFSRYVIENSLVINVPSHIRIGGGGTFDGVINHLTWDGGASSDGFAAYVGDDLDVQTRFTFTNVLAVPHLNQGVLGQITFPPDVFAGPGTPIRLPGATVTKNVMANPKPGYSLTNANWPAGNFIDGVTTASVAFVNSAIEATWNTDPVDGICAALTLSALSPYHLAGTDGKDIGADMTALRAALIGASGPATGTLVFTREPVGGVSGGLLSVQPRVESRLAGVTDVTDTRHVTFTLITLSGGPGVLSGTTSGNLVAGVFDPGNIHVAGAGTYEIGVDFV